MIGQDIMTGNKACSNCGAFLEVQTGNVKQCYCCGRSKSELRTGYGHTDINCISCGKNFYINGVCAQCFPNGDLPNRESLIEKHYLQRREAGISESDLRTQARSTRYVERYGYDNG